MASRTDFFGATAHCEIAFPSQVRGKTVAGDPIRITFDAASRGCGTREAFDPDRNRNVFKLESLLTVFHADDRRPRWMKALMGFSGGRLPQDIPKPGGRVAKRLLENYGPGPLQSFRTRTVPSSAR